MYTQIDLYTPDAPNIPRTKCVRSPQNLLIRKEPYIHLTHLSHLVPYVYIHPTLYYPYRVLTNTLTIMCVYTPYFHTKNHIYTHLVPYVYIHPTMNYPYRVLTHTPTIMCAYIHYFHAKNHMFTPLTHVTPLIPHTSYHVYTFTPQCT